MIENENVLHNEIVFHDAIAEKIEINDNLVSRFFAYDSPASYMADRLPRLKHNLLNELKDVRGKRVLVYGCGVDSASVWFSKSGAYVDAIDISPKSVKNQEVISNKLNLKIHAMIMDAQKLDLPSDEYDIVYGNGILHHLDLQRAMSEIGRVLKPEGKALFREVMRGNIFLQAFRIVTPFWRTSDEHPLKSTDFELLDGEFHVQVSQYLLSGLPYFLFVRIMNDVIFKKLKTTFRIQLNNGTSEFFDKLDQLLFRVLPWMKKQAWICLIILTKREVSAQLQ